MILARQNHRSQKLTSLDSSMDSQYNRYLQYDELESYVIMYV
jgi:hypothetical protein